MRRQAQARWRMRSGHLFECHWHRCRWTLESRVTEQHGSGQRCESPPRAACAALRWELLEPLEPREQWSLVVWLRWWWGVA